MATTHEATRALRSRPRYRKHTPRVRAILANISPDDHVLDLGAVQHDADAATDPDWLHGLLRQHAAEVTGVDIEASEVRELQKQGYDIRVGDVCDLPESFGPVDTVVAGELVEHLSDVGGFFESVSRILRPGGQLVLTTPNPWGIHFLKQALLNGRVGRNPTHTLWMDEEMLRLHCERHGFVDVDVEYIEPEERGLTRLAWLTGRECIGSTNLLLTARRPPEDD